MLPVLLGPGSCQVKNGPAPGVGVDKNKTGVFVFEIIGGNHLYILPWGGFGGQPRHIFLWQKPSKIEPTKHMIMA